MEYLSTILEQAKNEIEADWELDDIICPTLSQGFCFEALGENYLLTLTTKRKQTTLEIESNSKLIYSRTFKATQTMADLLKQLDKDIIIYTAVESIEKGWQDQICGSGGLINFMDYTPYIDKIRQIAQEKGINADITTSFSGLAWEFLR